MTRERVEEILHEIGVAESSMTGVFTCPTTDIVELCTLALRGLPPKVDWVEDADAVEDAAPYTYAQFGIFILNAYRYLWDIEVDGTTVSSGTADSLEAAQKAAEDALLKLVGGEG